MGTNPTGMEVASYLSNKAASVTVVGSSSHPFHKSLGQEIGKMCMQVRNLHVCDGNFCLMKRILKRFLLSDAWREKCEVLHEWWSHRVQRQQWKGGTIFIVLFCMFLYKPVSKQFICIKWPKNPCKLNGNFANLCWLLVDVVLLHWSWNVCWYFIYPHCVVGEGGGLEERISPGSWCCCCRNW